MVSIIIPVLNEETDLARTIQAAIQAARPDDEIILADGGFSGSASRMVSQKPDWENSISTLRCLERRQMWHILRQAVGHAHGEYILISMAHEWLEGSSIPNLESIAKTIQADAVQGRRIKRIKGITVKEPLFDAFPTETRIDGSDYRQIISLSGDLRLITPHISDKLWRRDLLNETFRISFNGEWGTGEVLSFHYFRHARSIAFTNTPISNRAWSEHGNAISYRRLSDLEKVYELKILASPNEIDGLRSELQAYLAHYISNLIFRLGWTRQAVVHYLSPVLAGSFWEKVGIETNPEVLIDEAFRTRKRHSFKLMLRRWLS